MNARRRKANLTWPFRAFYEIDNMSRGTCEMMGDFNRLFGSRNFIDLLQFCIVRKHLKLGWSSDFISLQLESCFFFIAYKLMKSVEVVKKIVTSFGVIFQQLEVLQERMLFRLHGYVDERWWWMEFSRSIPSVTLWRWLSDNWLRAVSARVDNRPGIVTCFEEVRFPLICWKKSVVNHVINVEV